VSRFELVCPVACRLGECPVWLADVAELAFVDVAGRRLHRFSPSSGTLASVEIEEDIGFVAPARTGGFVAGLRTGIWLLAHNPGDAHTMRFNDGGIDSRGRLLIGTIDESRRHGRAGLYRLDVSGLTPVACGLMTSNGVAFAPDGRTLYHSDTPRFVIYGCDYRPESGEVGRRRVFARLDPEAADRGRPDGAAVDQAGDYWCALYEGSRVNRYDAGGNLVAEYPLPVRSPTMPAFGDDDLRTLYVTTAQAADGSGGGLYAMRVATPGLAHQPFEDEGYQS